MMTVSAFGSSVARVYPVAVLVAGSRHVAATDVNSRYLIYTPLISFESFSEFALLVDGLPLTECFRNPTPVPLVQRLLIYSSESMPVTFQTSLLHWLRNFGVV